MTRRRPDSLSDSLPDSRPTLGITPAVFLTSTFFGVQIVGLFTTGLIPLDRSLNPPGLAAVFAGVTLVVAALQLLVNRSTRYAQASHDAVDYPTCGDCNAAVTPDETTCGSCGATLVTTPGQTGRAVTLPLGLLGFVAGSVALTHPGGSVPVFLGPVLVTVGLLQLYWWYTLWTTRPVRELDIHRHFSPPLHGVVAGAAAAIPHYGIHTAATISPSFDWTQHALSHLGASHTGPGTSLTATILNASVVVGALCGVLFIVLLVVRRDRSGSRTVLTQRTLDDTAATTTVSTAGERVILGLFGVELVFLAAIGLFPVGTDLHAPVSLGFFVLVTVTPLADAFTHLISGDVEVTSYGPDASDAGFVWTTVDPAPDSDSVFASDSTAATDSGGDTDEAASAGAHSTSPDHALIAAFPGLINLLVWLGWAATGPLTRPGIALPEYVGALSAALWVLLTAWMFDGS